MGRSNMHLLSTKQFSVRDHRLVAEVSDIQTSYGFLPSCLKVESHKTGKVLDFIFEHCNHDLENEVTDWVYTSKALPGWVMVIFND
jgi:hypothetical protein